MKLYVYMFVQLGSLLRELGALWWRARELLHGSGALAPHAEYAAAAQAQLARAHAARARGLSYQPERGGREKRTS